MENKSLTEMWYEYLFSVDIILLIAYKPRRKISLARPLKRWNEAITSHMAQYQT
jgi:hypothetical protein